MHKWLISYWDKFGLRLDYISKTPAEAIESKKVLYPCSLTVAFNHILDYSYNTKVSIRINESGFNPKIYKKVRIVVSELEVIVNNLLKERTKLKTLQQSTSN